MVGADHKRPNYERLNNWFRLYLRFSVGAIIIHYGATKLVPRQFPPPMLAALVENYGDMSPMGLLWNCIGISPLYGFFGGVGEVLGGTLLIIPQTALLGALISMAVMGNVLALNLGYDVTVKLMSVHLVAICALLLLPDLKRLADLFVFNRRVDRPKPRPLFGKPRWNRVAVIAQITVSLLLVGFYLNLHAARRHARQPGESDLAARHLVGGGVRAGWAGASAAAHRQSAMAASGHRQQRDMPRCNSWTASRRIIPCNSNSAPATMSIGPTEFATTSLFPTCSPARR